MTKRTAKELLEAARQVLETQKKRKKRNLVQVVKQHGPEEATNTMVKGRGTNTVYDNEIPN